MAPSTSSLGLYRLTLFFFSRLSHKLYVQHTWYKKNNTDSHVQLLTNTEETHKPARKNFSAVEDVVGHLSRWEDGVSQPATRLQPCFLAPTSSAPVFLEINQIKKTQASKIVKSCHKIWNIWISHLLSPANNEWIMLLPISLCKKKVKDDVQNLY